MALDFTDYDGLQQAIADTLNRQDLEEEIPGWIQLAEEKHKTEVRIRDMLTRTTTQITARTLALPTGFLELKRLRVAATSTGHPYDIEQVSSEELTKYWRSTSIANGLTSVMLGRPANMPKYVAIDELFEFDVDPSMFTDDEPYAQILYWKALTALSDNNTSNALLTRAPGVYFYGALVHSAPFLLDDERIAIWQTAYSAGVAALNAVDRKRGGPLVTRLAGAAP